MDTPTNYYVIDRVTRKRMGKPYKCKTRARRRVDKLDNDYGSYRYAVSDASGFLI